MPPVHTFWTRESVGNDTPVSILGCPDDSSHNKAVTELDHPPAFSEYFSLKASLLEISRN